MIGFDDGRLLSNRDDSLVVLHPALAFLSKPTLAGIRRVSVSRNGLVVTCHTAEGVKAVSDDLRKWDDSGKRYEHHIRNGGYVVVDW